MWPLNTGFTAYLKTSLKIPQGQSESVYRRTDNTMAKRKSTKGQILFLFHLTIVLSVMGQCLSFVFFIWPLYCLLLVFVCPLYFSFDHCIVCYGSLFVLCLFHFTIVLSFIGHCLSFVFFILPFYCLSDNTMDIWTRQRKTMTHNRQYNGQMKKKKDKQWPITDNTMVKYKRQRTNIDP
jgi:predicted membrane protein